MQYLVNKGLLDLHDKYYGDLGLLSERWACKEDREVFSSEQIGTLGEYVDQLHIAKVSSLSCERRETVVKRIRELEESIDPEVIAILRKRIQ